MSRLAPCAAATCTLSVLTTAALGALCGPGIDTTLGDVLTRVERDRPHYLFIGERHAVGPVKKFTVDLVNGLVDRGLDVGLYVEGLSTRCPPRALECSRLAPLFNAEAFRSLLDESRAVVHPLDPPGSADRAASMAAEIEWGSEDVRVVLVGNTHVRFAGRPDATLPIFGGGLLYPDPGDLAEAFPLRDTLTFVLETTDDGTDDALAEYSVVADGCEADYAVRTRSTRTY